MSSFMKQTATAVGGEFACPVAVDMFWDRFIGGPTQVDGGQLSLHYKIGFVVGYGFLRFALSDVDMNYSGLNPPL